MTENSPEFDALLQEEHAPWEALEDDTEAGRQGVIKLSRLFASRPDDVLRTLQSRGVIKLGEFKEKSNLVYPAFKSSSILTTGASERFIDYEQLWRQELRQRAGPGVPGGWSADVVVEAFVVNVADAADPDKDGIIQPLLKRWQAGGCSLATFGLPALQAVISFKWRAFARRLLLCQLGFFMVWIASFVTFTALFQDENLSLTLGQLMATRRGAATVAAELVALLAMTPFLVLEYGTLCAYGVSGWFSVWNGLDLITYTIQISVSAMHLCRWKLKSDALSNLLALQCIFLLFRLQYYSRVFRSTRFAFLEAIRDVIFEIRHYFAFLLIIMLGFAASFHILFRRDQAVSHFDTLPHAFLKVYMSQSGLDYEERLKSHVPVTASLLNVAYAFVMGMVLVNLLVGIMSTALNRVTEHEGLKLLLSKAQVIDELEATLPRWLEDRFEGQWYPKFIHVLRIDPDRVDKVDLDALWASGAQKEGGLDISVVKEGNKALEARLEAIQAQLARLEGCMGKSGLAAAENSALIASVVNNST